MRSDYRHIDDRASGHLQSLRRQVPLHLVKQRLAQIMRFERSSDRTIAIN
jgi:hypothetical protein